jgi:23S rRNA (pseudouridine1915-N3)-methyltransferase
MKVMLLFMHKTGEVWLNQGIEEYLKRLHNYLPVEMRILQPTKIAKLSVELQKKAESELFLKNIEKGDFLVLLDERGKQLSSEGLADFMQNKMNSGIKRLVIVVGGAYGFSETMYSRADYELSFSKFTFSHQMIRLLLVEQLYRSMTILRNEPYHHQ